MVDEPIKSERIKEALRWGEENVNIDYRAFERAKLRLRQKSSQGSTYNIKSLFYKRKMRLSLVFVMLILLIGGVVGVCATTIFKTDNINYPFVDDSQIIGKWKSVDIVSTVSEFTPGKRSRGGYLFLNEYAFIKDGKILLSFNEGNKALSYTPSTWTKGIILDPLDKTASKYQIVNIDGRAYMFLEWKSGDYVIGGLQPSLYVLEQVDSMDYSQHQIQKKVDDVDYEFTDDPKAIGDWEAVDFVKNAEQFNPQIRNFLPDLYLTGISFKEKGKLKYHTLDNKYTKNIRWTKGLCLNLDRQTASAYTIEEIDGTAYMFIEWKTDDYVYRDIKPYYYVLRKKK